MKPQRIAVYKHNERKLFFISLINEDRYRDEARIEKQYSRARSAHKAIVDNRAKESIGGLMFALINTDFDGWDVEHFDELYLTKDEVSAARISMIEHYSDLGWINVGTDRRYVKGVYGTYQSVTGWNRRLDVTKMTKPKIYDKIYFLFKSIEDAPCPKIVNQVYLGITCPEKFGPRAKNFGSYVIDSLANIFLFTRNLRGLDLP